MQLYISVHDVNQIYVIVIYLHYKMLINSPNYNYRYRLPTYNYIPNT